MVPVWLWLTLLEASEADQLEREGKTAMLLHEQSCYLGLKCVDSP